MDIDKGIIKGLIMIILIISLVGAGYITLYVYGIIGGSIFYAVNSSETVNVANTADSFVSNDTTPQSLSFANINDGSLVIYNASQTFGLTNFTIDYDAGTILTLNTTTGNETDGDTLLANYTYKDQQATNSLPVTSDAIGFMDQSENDFFTTMGTARTGMTFVGGLIAVAVILLVFVGFINRSKGGKGGNLGY